MSSGPTKTSRWNLGSVPLKIAAIYVIVSAMWIAFSDQLASVLFRDPGAFVRASTIKGWVFVVVTGLMLYALIRRNVEEIGRSEQALREVAEGVSSTIGSRFFRSLVQHLAQALGTDYAFVGEITGELNDSIRTIALYGHGQFGEDFEYELSGTPCENVTHEGPRAYTEGTWRQFPRDPLLADLKIESYIGIPLMDSSGVSLGLMVVMSTKPLVGADAHRAETILRIFAVRAAAELERKQTEEALQKERDRAQEYLDVAGVAMLVLGADQVVRLINEKGLEILGYSESEVIGRNWFDAFVPEGVRSKVRAAFDRLVSGEAESLDYYENSIVTKSGDVRLMAWHNRVMRDEEGRIYAALSSGEDITESRRAREALRESEERFRAIYENAPVMIEGFDVAGRCILWNKECEKQLGYSREEMEASPDVLAVFYPDSEELERVRKEIAEKSGVFSEFHAVARDGTVHSQLWADFGMPDGSLIAVGHDITDIRLAEESLRRSEEKYRNLVESTNDLVWEVDGDLVLTYLSPRVQDLLGFGPEELLGTSVFERMTPEEGNRVSDALEPVVSRHEPFVLLEHTLLRKDGSPVAVEASGTPVFDERGVFRGYRGIDRDITERKRYEETLRDTNQRLRTLIEASPLGILTLDTEGIVRMWNPAAERIFGWSRQEVEGKPIPYLGGDKEAISTFNATYQRVLSGRSITGVGMRRYHRDGSPVEISLSAAPLYGADGKISGVMGMIADITESKRTQEAIQKSEERERQIHIEAENAKREFYKGTIFSVTDGKLILVSHKEIEALLQPGGREIAIEGAESLAEVRNAAAEAARSIGMPDDRVNLLVTAVGEAAANAVKHANGGIARIATLDGRIQVSVRDEGRGMDSLILPKATLMRGFSTKPSLGLGYSLILAAADTVYLATEKRGTWVAMEMSAQETEGKINIDSLPDLW